MASESATAAPTSCAPAAGMAVVADSGDAPAAAAAAPVPAPLTSYDSRMLQNAPRYAIERGALSVDPPLFSAHECYRCQETARGPTRPFVWEGGRREPWYLCELPGFCYKGVADAVARGWDPDLCTG